MRRYKIKEVSQVVRDEFIVFSREMYFVVVERLVIKALKFAPGLYT